MWGRRIWLRGEEACGSNDGAHQCHAWSEEGRSKGQGGVQWDGPVPFIGPKGELERRVMKAGRVDSIDGADFSD
jgi:hypothetical protein